MTPGPPERPHGAREFKPARDVVLEPLAESLIELLPLAIQPRVPTLGSWAVDLVLGSDRLAREVSHQSSLVKRLLATVP